MNISLAVNLSVMEGTSRLLVHSGLAAAGVVAMMLGAADLFPPAWKALRERRLVTEHLFLTGMAAAWGVSLYATLSGHGAVFYEVPILLPAIRRMGGILLGYQQRSIESAAQALLMGVAGAQVRREGGWHSIPLTEVRAGDITLARAGQGIFCDAVIVAGRAYVQARSLTGEPFPIALEVGDPVHSGMVPMDGDLELRVVSTPADSSLSRLTEATRILLERPPAFLKSAEGVLAWFFPVVLLTSGATLFFWAARAGWPAAIANSLAVVLVACPCAFGMALPLLFRRGLAACLKRGIEPRDASFMELLSMVKVVALDKTGTLTVPELTIADLVYRPGMDPDPVRAVLAALHARSDHPVARPFWQWVAGAEDVEVRSLEVVAGRGLGGEVWQEGKWRAVRLGHPAFLSASLPDWARRGTLQDRRLYVEVDGVLAAVCLLAETMRPGALGTCRELSAAGLRVALLTGDAATPSGLAEVCREIHTSQRPADKAGLVRAWQEEGNPVLFVGDGINDAPALAAASASIALGEVSALAGASAQALWKSPELDRLPSLMREAFALASRARLILRTALFYNLTGMAFAAAGLLHPVAAAVIMLLSSATVLTLAARVGDPATR